MKRSRSDRLAGYNTLCCFEKKTENALSDQLRGHSASKFIRVNTTLNDELNPRPCRTLGQNFVTRDETHAVLF